MQEGEGGSGKGDGKKTEDDSDDDTEEERERWGGGDAEGIAKVGRAFDVKETPYDTWEFVFATIIGELEQKGHLTLQKKRRKMVSLLGRKRLGL